MARLPFDGLAEAFADIRAGRRTLVAVGAAPHAEVIQRRCPLPISYFVDLSPTRWGGTCLDRPVRPVEALAREDPGTTVLMLCYHGGPGLTMSLDALAGLGDFPWFLPPLGDPPVADPWQCLVLPPPADHGDGDIVVLVEQLKVGGAERQACFLAAGLAQAGHQVRLVTLRPALAQAGSALLNRDSVPVEVVEPLFEVPDALLPLPPGWAPQVHGLAEHLKARRPSGLITLLDRPNVMGGLAAALAGIPQVLLSVRNVAPIHFPQHFAGAEEDLAAAYRLLLRRPGVVLSSNSRTGAASYAGWLGIAEDGIRELPNALSELPEAQGGGGVFGVFRLAEEKRPEDFVAVVRHLGEVATLVGDGPLADRCRDGAIRLVGEVADPAAVLAGADLLLHVAEFEGMPNAVLEAQAMGIPVVAAAAPGTLEALAPCLRPYAAPVGDVEGLTRRCAALLGDEGKRRALGREAAAFVRRRHSLTASVDAALTALFGDDWRALCRLAEQARDATDRTRALNWSARAAALAPAEPRAVLLHATLLRQNGEPRRAVTVLEEALARRPADVDLWNHLGLARRAACDGAGALGAFRRAACLDPADVWAETNMAFTILRDPGEASAETFAPLGRRDDAAEIGLGLFCDRFPHTYGFLLQQFQTYLREFPDARAYSFGRKVMEPFGGHHFGEAMERWSPGFPTEAARVHQLVPELDDPARPGESRLVRVRLAEGRFRKPALAHNIFAMNADLFRPLYETLGIPFTFTLNPGGGFRLDDPYSDDRLRRVFDSKWFRRVIVTYPLTRDYIMARLGVPEAVIELIPGTIVLEGTLMRHLGPKRRLGEHKDTLDICFAGMRYTPRGTDKGYDRFIAACGLLVELFPHLRVHVVGDFTPDMVDVSALAGRIAFHGKQDQRWMAGFFAGMDAILSPNIPGQITKGAFDGFPVTTCIEAAMCGVALFASDPMGLNFALTDGVDYVAIDVEPRRLAEQMEPWLADPARLYALAEAGRHTVRRVWGEAAQMGPRVALFRRLLGGG